MEEPMDDQPVETWFLREQVTGYGKPEDLKKVVRQQMKTQRKMCQEKIKEILKNSGLTKADFASLCGASRPTLDKWCKGSIPRYREMFLRLGLIAHYNVEQMNQFLQRCGHYPGLYPKSLEDCVALFVIRCGNQENLVEQYDYILQRVKNEIFPNTFDENRNIGTVLVRERLERVHDESELDRFVSENSSVFTSAFNRFYNYVITFVEENYGKDSLYNATTDAELADGQDWSASMRTAFSNIRQRKWYPTRNKIISLGIHLTMDAQEIDEMLELAHMEPLCAKNTVEGVLLYILERAEDNLRVTDETHRMDSRELCDYILKTVKELNLGCPEIDDFMKELEEPLENDHEWKLKKKRVLPGRDRER